MVITRSKRPKHYSIIDNDLLDDKRLSFKARGLLSYMLSKPDNWRFYVEELADHSEKDGVKAIRSAIKELEEVGYMKRIQRRSKDGKFLSNDWEVMGEPPINPLSQKGHAVKGQLLITEYTNYLYTNNHFSKMIANALLNKLNLLSYKDDKQILDTANVVIKFKDQLRDELLVYGIERVRQNQVHNSNIKNNVAGYLTSVYKHWLDSDITTLEEAKRETKDRYTDDLDNNLYSEAHIECITAIWIPRKAGLWMKTPF